MSQPRNLPQTISNINKFNQGIHLINSHYVDEWIRPLTQFLVDKGVSQAEIARYIGKSTQAVHILLSNKKSQAVEKPGI